MPSEVPTSSDELRKWLKVSREARTSIGRSLRAWDQAQANIERLVGEGSARREDEREAPGSG